MQSIESDLLATAQNGNAAAFERLIKPIESKMLGVAAGLAATPDEADDIYQDAMLNAFRSLPGFRVDSQFSTWLYRIVVNTAISRKRSLKSKLSKLVFNSAVVDDDPDVFEVYCDSVGPEKELQNSQLNRAITRALAELSEKERVAFVLCHQQGLKVDNAAVIMDCSDGAIKSYLFRAREKLRTKLKMFY